MEGMQYQYSLELYDMESYVTAIEGEFLCVGGVEECLGDEMDVKVDRKLIAEVVKNGGDGAWGSKERSLEWEKGFGGDKRVLWDWGSKSVESTLGWLKRRQLCHGPDGEKRWTKTELLLDFWIDRKKAKDGFKRFLSQTCQVESQWRQQSLTSFTSKLLMQARLQTSDQSNQNHKQQPPRISYPFYSLLSFMNPDYH
jgi:hypothetical protein